MRTAEEIIVYLQAQMDESIDLHDAATDKAQRLAMMLKAYTISELLDEIKRTFFPFPITAREARLPSVIFSSLSPRRSPRVIPLPKR